MDNSAAREIPKKNGKLRPLGIPTWSDKILQEVIRSLLEAYYEPRFSDLSHGFRPGRGCHTALQTIQRTGWEPRGLSREMCTRALTASTMTLVVNPTRVHRDNRFLRLIEHLLKADIWKTGTTADTERHAARWHRLTNLSNIYLDQLDQFVEKTLMQNTREAKCGKTIQSLADCTKRRGI